MNNKERMKNLINSTPGLTYQEIRSHLNISKTTVFFLLRQLQREGIVKQVKNPNEYPYTSKIRYYLTLTQVD